MSHEQMAPGGTDARTFHGCTCPPEQIGPEYRADAGCPVHGLGHLLDTDMSDWITLERDGMVVKAPTREGAEAMLDRMEARRG